MIHDASCCLLLLTYRIRKAGFSIRYTFEEFVNRYRVVMTDLRIPDSELREMSEELAKSLFRDVEWTIGNRMIFLKVSLNNSFSKAFHFPFFAYFLSLIYLVSDVFLGLR